MGEEEQRRSTVTAALLVLVACNLALALSGFSPPPPSAHDDDDAARVEPVGYLASVASSVLAVCVASSAARHGRRRGRLSVEAVLREARRTWTRPAVTALYVELLTTAMASLLLTLRAFLGAAAATGGGAGAELMAVSASAALVAWLGPVLFAHSDIACRMSLVVAAVEKGRDAGGRHPLSRSRRSSLRAAHEWSGNLVGDTTPTGTRSRVRPAARTRAYTVSCEDARGEEERR